MTRKQRKRSRRGAGARNPFARVLRRGLFRQRRKPSGKVYRRREKHRERDD